MRRIILLSALSGCLWGMISYILGARAMGRIVWGGVLASPLIGLVIGLASRRLRDLPTWARVVGSLVSLYIAACLFGLAVGLFDIATVAQRGYGWHRNPGDVLTQSVLGMLWGLTFTGYLLLLWPLAYWNQRLIWRQ